MMFPLVELRGFEPLTSCMPCLAKLSEGVALGRGPADQDRFSVWSYLAGSEAVCVCSHLISHWSTGPPFPARGGALRAVRKVPMRKALANLTDWAHAARDHSKAQPGQVRLSSAGENVAAITAGPGSTSCP